MATLTPRKQVENSRPWPDDWTVYFEWEFTKGKKPFTVESRQHDIKVGQSWLMFERYVVTANGKEWLDAFELYPYGGYRTVLPGEVIQVRPHVDPKKTANGKH